MGDHRASIKIEMEFHGIKKNCDMWINYSGEDSEYAGVDDRVIEFIRSVYEKGMRKYHELMWKEREKEEEKQERAELKRLQKKYQGGGVE